MTKADSPKYYSPKEAAPLLTVSYWTVLRMIERQQLVAIKVGECYRITDTEIRRIMLTPANIR